jgi:hypothetical protein
MMGATGAIAVIAGLFLFLLPRRAIDVWPWHLTPLTSRVLGAVFMLGIAALGVVTDGRWSAARLMLQVQVLMLTLILVAAARAHADFDTSNAMTWLLLGGFLAAVGSAAALSVAMDARAGRRRPRRDLSGVAG